MIVTQTVLERLKPGATVVPLIVTTDHTQVTLFGNTAAYPLYLVIEGPVRSGFFPKYGKTVTVTGY